MIRTIARVVRGEGLGSAMRRAHERTEESLRQRMLLARGLFAHDDRAPILNVSPMPVVARLGGVPIQLRARLDEERALRNVALYADGVLQVGSHARRMSLAEAIARTGARMVHLEGTCDVPQDFIVSVHDLTADLRILERARAVIYPSEFLRDTYGIPGPVIEPGLVERRPLRAPTSAAEAAAAPQVAYVGAVKPHKGGVLLRELVAALPKLHVFGGGDEALLRAIRKRAIVHGYYRAPTLPALLAKHRIGLAILPSIVPEAFGLTLSECWRAGVPVIAFDHGALAERIRRHGGGWLVPIGEGADGIVRIVRRWLAGELTTTIPTHIPTARDAALAYVALYRALRVM